MLKPKKSAIPVYALHVVSDETDISKAEAAGKKMMEKAIKQAAATDSTIIPLTRFDVNISNGIIYTIKEHNITDVIIGLHHLATEGDQFLGPVAEKILQNTDKTIFIYKAVQPVNTLKRIIVVVPTNAEYEQGFQHWFERIQTISKETGLRLLIYASNTAIKILRDTNDNISAPLAITFEMFDNWDDFLIFSREVKQDDLFIIISSRKGYLSYNTEIDKLPKYLIRYFSANSYIILYPEQIEHLADANLKPLEENIELLDKAGNYVKRIFTKN